MTANKLVVRIAIPICAQLTMPISSSFWHKAVFNTGIANILGEGSIGVIEPMASIITPIIRYWA